ncbi:hypothetical protein SAMN05444128_3350 [Pontibacter indicus]|uniref:Uncharacterized protein n=1 Tax=Pontibacter indicus TaxID=1317125 RepID=A0A1R3XPY9_9BACT|nr:hypothetical protein SAMN05444128_3350 [Pontibacter indicus]
MRIQAVVRKGHVKELDEREDLLYWLNRSPRERMEAVTFIISQFLKPGQRMDKSAVTKRKISHDIS